MNHTVFGYFAPFDRDVDNHLDARLDFLSLVYQLSDNVSVIKGGTTRFYVSDYRKILTLEQFAKDHCISFSYQALMSKGFEFEMSMNDYFVRLNSIVNSRGVRKSSKDSKSSLFGT